MAFITSVTSGAQGGADAITSRIDNLLGRSNEDSRQIAADDKKFFRNLTSFFELQTPRGNFLFPFVYNFQSMAMSEPFAVQAVPTLDSGLVVHRSGIVQRRLQLSGSTGFAPHPLPMPLPVPFSATLLPKNYTDRNLQRKAFNALSGQRHLHYLQSVIIRLYSDLLIDKSTAPNTKLFFHCPQEDEHWQVEPMDFRVARSASSPLTYNYSIDLILVGPARATVFPVADVDKGFLDNIRDAVFGVNKALGSLRAAVNDLTALQGSIRILALETAGILSQANSVIDAANNFVTGTHALIDVPLKLVTQLFQTIQKTVELYAELAATGTALANWPRVVRARFRAMQNAINVLLLHPETFTVPMDQQLTFLNQNANRLAASEDVLPATSFGQLQAQGSANLPGDAELAASSLGPGVTQPTYLSIRSVRIRQGDTLASIAQAELGSAALWRALVVLNNISAPFTSASGVTLTKLEALRDSAGILVPGQTILVPSTAPPPSSVQTPEVLGVSPQASQEEQAFGRDLAFDPSRMGRIAEQRRLLVVSLPDGTQDIATVAGEDNLRQYLSTQVTSRKGANVLYPSVGIDAVVGSGYASADVSMATYRVSQALTQSARIQGLDALDLIPIETGTYIEAQLRTVLGSTVGVASVA